MHSFIRDLSLSYRSLRRSPGFTFVAVLTLTLAIAGNAVVFSVVNAILLRPLPYPESHRLVTLHWRDQQEISAVAFFLLKNRTHSFSSMAALYPVEVGVNVSAAGKSDYVKALSVSRDFFPTLGITPEMGRTFNAEEDQPNAPRTAILSYGLWTQKFNRDPSALGQDLRVNGESYKIIGIMPRKFRSYPDANVWLPLQLSPQSMEPGNNYEVIARLAPGVSRQEVQRELDGIAREYQLTYLPSAKKGTIAAQDLQISLVQKERKGLVILFAAVGFVLLIACTNVAVLILVRGAANTQKFAIHAALGPGRGRFILALMTESLLLSLFGGIFGLILAKESLPLVHFLWPADVAVSTALRVDWRVVLFTLGISILATLLFGLVPALRLSQINIAQALVHASRTSSASAEQVRTVRLLIFGQMALTVMLLAGTMLLLRSLFNLYSVPLGFEHEHLAVAQISLAGQRYRTTAAVDSLLNQAINRLKSGLDVDAVAAVDGLPLENGLNLPLHPMDMPQALDHADEYRPITASYFRTLHIPLEAGRFFTDEDRAGAAPVAIINHTMARHWWPGGSAIGQYIRVDEELGPQPADVPRQIIGIVSDIHEKGPGVPPPPTIFIPISQTPNNIIEFFNKAFFTSIVIRTSHAEDFSDQARSAIQGVDPDLPLASFRKFDQVEDEALANSRFVTVLTAAFGFFALVLTTIGIQGLLNYQARLHNREIAVRMAMGASRSHIIRMVIQQGGKLIFFAVLVGLAGSFLIKNLLGTLIYNTQSSSTLVIIATGFLLALIAALLSLLTAVEAAFIDPIAVLRNE